MYLEVVEKGSRQVSDRNDIGGPQVSTDLRSGRGERNGTERRQREREEHKAEETQQVESGNRLARGSPQSNEKVGATAR